MQSIYDVRQLLKKFGIFIYIGDRLSDLELMELELKELYDLQMIQLNDYQMALLVIRKEKRLIKENRGENKK